MDVSLRIRENRILILGAGASADYGLPVWKDLRFLIRQEISSGTNNNYLYKKEILEWLEKVGDEKGYETIDKCISKESVSAKYPKGDEIENELFSAIKNIFDKRYKKNDDGWIKILNEKILFNQNGLESSLAFINFNYDDVLEKNFLNFSYLHPKQQRLNYRLRLVKLSNIRVNALYPHGKFSINQDHESHVTIYKETMKSHDETLLDVVSCHESNNHTVSNGWSRPSFELYLMGLGNGLKINLNKIRMPLNSITTVHVTIKNQEMEKEIIGFLSEKYKNSEIKKYSTCSDLVEECF
jgi:hypothetical protein